MPKENKIVKSDENRITIRVWKRTSILPGVSLSTEENICGHASLQAYGDNKFYASFWPAEDERASKTNSVKGQLIDSCYKDCILEGRGEIRMPDIEVDLYSLDVVKIRKAFHEFKQIPQKMWSLLGSSTFSGNSKNCCGLVAFLLEVGNIKELVTSYKSGGSTLLYGGMGAGVGLLAAVATGGTALLFMGVGAGTSILANQTDAVEGMKVAITPDGIGALVIHAEKLEKAKYNLIELKKGSLKCV